MIPSNALEIMNAMRSAKNPQELLEEYARHNKNVREVIDMVNKCGDPKTAFYQMASAKGVDPEAILSMIRK
jgi:hypothetical protein